MFRASVVLAALLIAPDARAANFTVFNDNASGLGSLAQAITSANATATADTISFGVLGSGPIVIPGPLPSIQQPLTPASRLANRSPASRSKETSSALPPTA